MPDLGPSCAPKITCSARFWNIDAIFYAISYSYPRSEIKGEQTSHLISVMYTQLPEFLENGIRHALHHGVNLSFSSLSPTPRASSARGEKLKMGFSGLP
jgi:hypothetical protein